MDTLKKYFKFSGTINGTSYFLRQLLSTFIAYIGGLGIGLGVASGMFAITFFAIPLVTLAIWLSLSTMYKRFEALFPKQAGIYTISLFSAQTLLTFLKKDLGSISDLVKISLVLILLYLVFSNSNIENHEG